MDLGVFLTNTSTANERDAILSQLTDAQKYDLLTSHVKPTTILPKNESGRRFQLSWLNEYSWLRYSFAAGGAFCLTCAFFSTYKCNKVQLVIQPFVNWKKFPDKAQNHDNASYHKEAMHEACMFLQRKRNMTVTVTS